MKFKLFFALLISIITFAQTRPPDEKLTYISAALVEAAIAATITGTGTANQIAYFTGTKTIGSLGTATYPSLTELARIKGLTSSVQTQLNGKQATLVSGTTIKTINGQSLLGSGNIVIISDTTGLYAKVYAAVQSVMTSQSASIIGSKATLDSMIVDFRKNNYLRLNK